LLRDLTRRHRALLVFDEVKTGFRHHLGGYQAIAARATIDILAAGGVERMNRLGERLREGLRRAIRDTGVTATVTGVGSGWIVNWRAEPPVTFRQAVDADFDRAEAFRVAMLDAGILLPPYVITDNRICVAFSDDDVDATIDAARRAFAAVA
jgi:glutamate-1-semialdehyde 2,1-aminomutase